MELIVASDIFGRTPHLDALVAEVSSAFTRIRILSPYGDRAPEFGNEARAYAYFQENIGLNGYMDLLGRARADATSPLRLLGFSVGASALWGLSGSPLVHEDALAVCFYGSQIRHLTHIDPKMNMVMFFPAREPHFHVDRLISKLSGKTQVRCAVTRYLHGFMNPLSGNYDKTAYREYIRVLKNMFA